MADDLFAERLHRDQLPESKRANRGCPSLQNRLGALDSEAIPNSQGYSPRDLKRSTHLLPGVTESSSPGYPCDSSTTSTKPPSTKRAQTLEEGSKGIDLGGF